MQGYHGLVKTLVDNIYYYQDELGSTSHIANANGALLEYYKYDLYGKPTYWTATTPSSQLLASAYGVKDLFTGQRWIPELGLYDDRNRFMSPDLGRFLQPDPIGFKGDASNLYRYCGNDWANRSDPMGLLDAGDVKEFFYSVWYAGLPATYDAQPFIGNTTGKWAVDQGRKATDEYGKNPNAGEAVRHEAWQAELARKYGEQAAKAIGDAHEKFKSKDAQDSKRDQYHNELGRENAEKSKDRADSLDRAKKDWESGRAAKDKNDPKVEKAPQRTEKDDQKLEKVPEASNVEPKQPNDQDWMGTRSPVGDPFSFSQALERR